MSARATLRTAGLAAAILIALAALGATAIERTFCRDRTASVATSPSGKFRAEASGGYCTVGPGWDTDVVIRGRPFFLTYVHLGRATAVFQTNADPAAVRLHWASDKLLEVQCSGCRAGEYRRLTPSWRGVSIEVRALPGPRSPE